MHQTSFFSPQPSEAFVLSPYLFFHQALRLKIPLSNSPSNHFNLQGTIQIYVLVLQYMIAAHKKAVPTFFVRTAFFNYLGILIVCPT